MGAVLSSRLNSSYLGKAPKLSNGTLVEVTAEKKRDVDGEWSLQVQEKMGNR